MRRSGSSAVGRKRLPARRVNKSQSAAVSKKTAKRRTILRRGSDEELIRVFGEK
jgi:hypothetical protein